MRRGRRGHRRPELGTGAVSPVLSQLEDEALVAITQEARRQLYLLLAEDPDTDGTTSQA